MPKINLSNIINLINYFKNLNLKNFLNKIENLYKSEAFKMVVITFGSLIILTYLFPIFIDNSRLKYDICQRLSKLTQATVSIKGDISFNLLPSPRIEIDNVFIENYAPPNKRSEDDYFYNIYVKKLHIIFPMFKFNNKQLISKIIIDKSIIEIAKPEILTKIDNSLFNTYLKDFSNIKSATNPPNSSISSSIFSIGDIESTAIFLVNPPNIQLNDTTISFFDEGGLSKEFVDVNSTISYKNDIVEGYGGFTSQSIDNEFKISAKFNTYEDQPDSYFFLKSPILDLKINGNFYGSNIEGILKTKFSGVLDAEIKDLRNLYKSLISSKDIIANKLKIGNNKIKINSLINNNSDQFELKKMIITSTLGNGDGDFIVDLNQEIFTAILKLKFEDLNIDELWETQNPAKKIAETTKSNLIENAQKKAEKNDDKKNNSPNNQDQKISFKTPIIKIRKKNNSDIITNIKDYDIDIEIEAKNTLIYEEKIAEIKLFGNATNDDKLLISPLNLKLGNDSKFTITGILNRSPINSSFIGNLEGNGYSFYDITKWLDINNSLLNIDNIKSYNIYSDIDIDQTTLKFKNLRIYIDDKKTDLYGNIEIKDDDKKRSLESNITFTELDLNKYFFINNFFIKKGVLFDRLLLLNKVYTDYLLKFKFNKLIYNNEEFLDQSLTINIGQGYFKIPKTNFKSENNDFDFELNLDISDKKQVANFLINGDKLKINLIDKKPEVTTGRFYNIFDHFFELPSFQGFSGDINIKLNKIITENRIIENFEYLNSYTNSAFNPAKLSMKIYDGTFEFKGLNDIKYNKIINGNFNCKLCNSKEILKDLFNQENFSGVANISGNIVALAKSSDEFYKNLNSEISVAISAPKINKYGLSKLIKSMFNISENAYELKEPEKIMENPEYSTQFEQAKGTINLNNKRNNFSISLKSQGVNSIFSGVILPKENLISGTLNTIFISTTKLKTIPINVSTSISGPIDNFASVSNLNQTRQLIGLEKIDIKKLSEELQLKSREKIISKKNKSNINFNEFNKKDLSETDLTIDSKENNSINTNIPENEESKEDIDKSILLKDDKDNKDQNSSINSSSDNAPKINKESENLNIVQPSF